LLGAQALWIVTSPEVRNRADTALLMIASHALVELAGALTSDVAKVI